MLSKLSGACYVLPRNYNFLRLFFFLKALDSFFLLSVLEDIVLQLYIIGL